MLTHVWPRHSPLSLLRLTRSSAAALVAAPPRPPVGPAASCVNRPPPTRGAQLHASARVAMRIAVQVVAVAGGDSSPALLVATESHRYLFNAGEGLQRFCMEHRVRLSRVDGIFVTRVCNETMGGLPGEWVALA